MRVLIITFLISLTGYSQQVDGTELGFDVAFSASNFGGNAGLGIKYGFKFGEYIITGPSVRYERTWVKNQTAGTNGGYNVYGGGGFLHARFFNALFAGAELEILRSPYAKNGFLTTTGTWAPTFFLGGGFSMEFNESWRLNAGIMYDIINASNSPFQRSYFLTKKSPTGANAGYLPVIYRIAFFFPLS